MDFKEYTAQPKRVRAVKFLETNVPQVVLLSGYRMAVTLENDGVCYWLYDRETDSALQLFPGCWVVRSAEGRVSVCTEAAFRADFSEVLP